MSVPVVIADLRKNCRQRPLPTGRMMVAMTAALAEVAPEDRGELARWAASRLLLGYAQQAGFRAAADQAYRWADVLEAAA